MKIAEIKDILDAKVLYGDDKLDGVVTAGGAADLMDDVLATAAKGCVLLTGVTTDHVIRTAKIVGVGAIVIVRGRPLWRWPRRMRFPCYSVSTRFSSHVGGST